MAKNLKELNNQCIYRQQGWWTYEVCFEKEVNQFHKGHDKTTRINLGKVPTPIFHLDDKILQKYKDGDSCELKKMTRSTTIEYVCGTKDFDYIGEIREVLLCNYSIIIMTPKACKNTQTNHMKIECMKMNMKLEHFTHFTPKDQALKQFFDLFTSPSQFS